MQHHRTVAVVCLFVASMFATTASAQSVSYLIDKRESAKAYVIAYEALTYSVAGGVTNVPVGADSKAEINLAGPAGPIVKATLSSDDGYVVMVSSDVDYGTDNTSNDGLILARGQDGYVDSEFLVWNQWPKLASKPYNAFLIVTAMNDDAYVVVDDLTDNTDDKTLGEIKAGMAKIVRLTDQSLLRVTSTTGAVSVSYGLLNDGHAEVAPMTNGAIVGTEAFVTTTHGVAAMAMGDGEITVSVRGYDITGQPYEVVTYKAPVKRGQMLSVPNDYRQWNVYTNPAVRTYRIAGTAPFYAYSTHGTSGSPMFGGTFVPPDLSPGVAQFQQYYVASLNEKRQSIVDVYAAEATSVTLKEVWTGATVTQTTTSGGLASFTLEPSIDSTRSFNMGVVDYTWEISTDKPVTVVQRHAYEYERATVVFPVGHLPAAPPGLARLAITDVQVVPDRTQPNTRTEYLALDVEIVDVNGNMTTWDIAGPGGSIKNGIPSQYITTTAGVGGSARVHIRTGWPGVPKASLGAGYVSLPTLAGTYTITAQDAKPAYLTRTHVIRGPNAGMTSSVLMPVRKATPDSASQGIGRAPQYTWFSPPTPFASFYRVEVATSADFAAASIVLPLDSTRTDRASVYHKGAHLALDTRYYWRVWAFGSTIEYGADVAVVGPTWSFTTTPGVDRVAPRFVTGPGASVTYKASSGGNVPEISVHWDNDEATDGKVRIVGSTGNYGIGLTYAVGARGATHTAKIPYPETNIAYKYPRVVQMVAEATDAAGNTSTSPVFAVSYQGAAAQGVPEFATQPTATTVTETKAVIFFSFKQDAFARVQWNLSSASSASSAREKADYANAKREWSVEIGPLLPDTSYTVQVVGFDDEGGQSSPAIYSFRTLSGDTQPPGIIGTVSVAVADTDRAVIEWKTDENAFGRVRFGTNRTQLIYSQREASEQPWPNHHVEMLGLLPNTWYYYTAVSTDPAGNEGVSAVDSVRTRAIPDIEGPKINPPRARKDRGKVLTQGTNRTVPEAHWGSNELNIATIEVAPGPAKPTLGVDGRMIEGTCETCSSFYRFDEREYAHEHKVDLVGLPEGNVYWATIIARDRAGNVTVGDTIRFGTRVDAPVDNAAPTIKSSTISASATTALLRVELSEPADAVIYYGREHYKLDFTKVDLTRTDIHELLFTGLEPNTEYFYVRQFRDAANNMYIDSAPLSFRTLQSADRKAPEIVNGPSIVYRSDDRIVVHWWTDEPTTGRVYYRKASEPTAVAEFQADPNLATYHQLTIPNLTINTPYDFAITGADAAGNELIYPQGATLRREARGMMLVKAARASGGRLGAGSFSTSTSSDNTPPVITGGPDISMVGQNQAQVTWTTDEPASGGVNYGMSGGSGGRIARTAEGEGLGNEVVDNTVTTSHNVIIVINEDGTITYEVESTDPSGNTTTSTTEMFTADLGIDTDPPVITEAATVLSKTNNRAVIRWVTNEPSDSQVDVLQRGLTIDQRTTFNMPDLVKEHVVTVTGLKAQTVYDYLVSSVDGSNNGPVTGMAAFITDADPDLTKPVVTQAPQVVKKDDVSATIHWRTDEATDTYVEYGLSTSFGLVAQDAKRDTGHTITLANLTAGQTYYYRVQAEDAAGNVYIQPSASTFITDAAPDVTAPAVPRNFYGLPGSSSMYLAWDANTEPDLAGYTLQRSASGGAWTTIATRFSGTSYYDRNLTNGVLYDYRLAAVDKSRNANQSAWVDPVTAVMAPGAEYVPQAPGIFPYPIVYWDQRTNTGEPFRPVFIISNVAPAVRPGARMTYSFVVATDPSFTNTISTGANVPPGDVIVGLQDTWWPYAVTTCNQSICIPDSTWYNPHLFAPDPNMTSWIPTRHLTPGQLYYWRARANDGIFDGQWTAVQTFTPGSGFIPLDPERANFLRINLRPEQMPTAIRLAAFMAEGNDEGIAISWRIEADGEQATVAILRGSREDGEFVAISPELTAFDGRFFDTGAMPGTTWFYKVRVTRSSGASEVHGLVSAAVTLPRHLALDQNVPNPFNPVTVIPYALPARSRVRLAIYDATGRHVRTLVESESQLPGRYRALWDGSDATGRSVGSGTYVARIETTPADGGASAAKVVRMTLVR